MEKATLRQALSFLGAKLDVLAGKEKLEIVAHIERAEMTETNKLLKELIAREKEPIEVTLRIL